MQSDLTYAIYIVLAALVVGATMFGGVAYAYFAEERWGRADRSPRRAEEAQQEGAPRDEQRTARGDHDLAA